MTQKDRVESNLHRIEIESYIKQIDCLKQSEVKLKRQLNKVKEQMNSQLKDCAENAEKYAKELEMNKEINEKLKLQSSQLQEYEAKESVMT